MREGWQTVSIGDIATVSAGNSAPQNMDFFVGGTYPFVRTSDVGKIRIGSIESAADKLNEEGIKKLRLFLEGTILFPKSGASTFLNHRVILARDSYVSSHLATIKADDRRVLDRYLFYYLTTVRAQDLIQSHDYPSLKRSDIQSIAFPLPPLPEQMRIVAILDEAFEGIGRAVANAEKNLANARELFESYLNAVFTQKGDGWVETTLGSVCTEFGRGKSKHRPRNDPSLYGGKYPFVQTGDISNADHVIENHTQTYSEAGFAQSKLWPKGTICLAIVGATIGETGVLDFDACFPDSVIGMIVDLEKSDAYCIEYMLQTFKPTIKAKGKGSARHNINLRTFQDQKFPIPPLGVQREIVSKLDALAEETQNLYTIYRQKLDDLAELKQSILQKAFAGELTAQPDKLLGAAVA